MSSTIWPPAIKRIRRKKAQGPAIGLNVAVPAVEFQEVVINNYVHRVACAKMDQNDVTQVYGEYIYDVVVYGPVGVSDDARLPDTADGEASLLVAASCEASLLDAVL
mgnify:CR=1 FL=1